MPVNLSDLDYEGRVDGADGRGCSVCTCWSSVTEEPGPCWGLAEPECVYAGESVRACVRARARAG